MRDDDDGILYAVHLMQRNKTCPGPPICVAAGNSVHGQNRKGLIWMPSIPHHAIQYIGIASSELIAMDGHTIRGNQMVNFARLKVK